MYLIKLRQQKTHNEPTKNGVIRISSGDTNWSLVEPRADFSPPQPQNDDETLVDAPWPEIRHTKNPWTTDLKQENTSQQNRVKEEQH